MAIQRISSATLENVQPIGASGSYALQTPMTPGLYRIGMDTTQSLSSAQLFFQTSGGFRFGAAVRGGEGYVSIPQGVASVIFTAGTFPLLLSHERILSYNLISAPASVSFTYAPLTPWSTTISYAVPAGATSMGIYWADGTFTDFAKTTSPHTMNLPYAPTSGSVFPGLVVAKDANGVWGLGTENASRFPFYLYTTSQTYTRPSWSSSTKLIASGGGGGGGGSQWSDGPAGSGGGGAAVETTSSASSIVLVIGAGGNGGTSAPSAVTAGAAGGQTVVASASYAGGLGAAAFTGSPGQGAGAASGSGRAGSPGGGGGGASASAVGSAGGAGLTGTGNFSTIIVGGGGSRGTQVGSIYGRGGAGGVGIPGASSPGGAGGSGVVLIEAII